LDAVHRLVLAGSRTELSPSLLSQACVEVVQPIEGAGISMSQKALRVPLGWSDEDVGTAEQLQSTLGDGPCLAAMHTGAPLVADAKVAARQWPIYFDDLTRLTRFRSVASLPLCGDDGKPFGALDLYTSSTELSSTLPLPDIADAVAGPIAMIVSGAFAQLYDEDARVPAWLDAGPAVDRMSVWTAVGMLRANSSQTDADALATLRAWAYSRGQTIDEVAGSLVDRELTVDAILVDSP
jgi:hypothetical protein